jgi:hypothetical protein
MSGPSVDSALSQNQGPEVISPQSGNLPIGARADFTLHAGSRLSIHPCHGRLRFRPLTQIFVPCRYRELARAQIAIRSALPSHRR